MAEKIIQFKAKKEIFDKAAARLACSDCKVVPKDIPIFQSGQGDVLCSICKPNSKLTGIFRSSVLEDLLMSLPISCKFQKNECPVVLQDRENLSYHEEDCEHRDVLCPDRFCEERIPAIQFKNHFLQKHEIDLEKDDEDVTKMTESGVYKVKREMLKEYFSGEWQFTCWFNYNDSKSFILFSRDFDGYNLSWLQLVGSQFEAKNFEYSLKVEGPLDVGKFYYDGTVRSLDDDKNELFEKGLGLAIFHGALKKLIQDDHYDIEVKIKDLKAELNKGEDTQIPMSEEDD